MINTQYSEYLIIIDLLCSRGMDEVKLQVMHDMFLMFPVPFDDGYIYTLIDDWVAV